MAERLTILFCFAFSLAKPQLIFDADSNLETIRVRLGENVSLKCPFKNFDHFQWFENTEQIDNQILRLELENVSFKDAGKDRCICQDPSSSQHSHHTMLPTQT